MKHNYFKNSPAANDAGLFLFPSRICRAYGAVNYCFNETKGSECAVLVSGNYCMKEYGSMIEVPGELKYLKFPGSINPAEIYKLTSFCAANGADTLIGLGGGKVMDICKMAKKNIGNIKLVLIPSSAATCAAFTPVSVIYNKDGSYMTTADSLCPDVLLFDYKIFHELPQGFYAAGMIDALAKFLEIKRAKAEGEKADAFDAAAEKIAQDSFFRISEIIRNKWNNFDSGAREETAELNILLSGLVSCVGAQTAAVSSAHALAHALTIIPAAREFLHGEHVGLGLLFQETAAGHTETADDIRELLAVMGCPDSFSAFGIKEDEMDAVIDAFIRIQKEENINPFVSKEAAIETAFGLYK